MAIEYKFCILTEFNHSGNSNRSHFNLELKFLITEKRPALKVLYENQEEFEKGIENYITQFIKERQ